MIDKMAKFVYNIGNTMLIGLISDTHVPDHASALPKQLKEVFRDVDLILHAGDIYAASVLDELECLAPVKAAAGDDDPTPTLHDRRVKQRHILNIDGTTIWLIHDKLFWPLDSKGIYQHERTPDVIVFGHTHHATMEEQGHVLLINPGSPTLPGYRFKLGTVALLNINSDKAEANIVQLQ